MSHAYLFNTKTGRFFATGYGMEGPNEHGVRYPADAELLRVETCEAFLDDMSVPNADGIVDNPWVMLSEACALSMGEESDESDTKRTAEDLTEEERGVLIGMGERPREWLDFIREKEICTDEDLVNALVGWIGEHELGKCLRANEMSPDFMLDDETVNEMLEDLDDG
jgi:hypothetical protein